MKILLQLLLITSLRLWQCSAIRCYQCTENYLGCDKDPDQLYLCPDVATMCYLWVGDKDRYERGCLGKGNTHWEECVGQPDNTCYTCYGEGCNHMQIKTPSTLNCVQCTGKECYEVIAAKPCKTNDLPLGPASCVTRFGDMGKDIHSKNCWNNLDLTLPEYTGHRYLYYKCKGDMCNYQNTNALQRCVRSNSQENQYKRRIVMCYLGTIPIRYSHLMGCFREMKGYPVGNRLIFTGCNSYRATNNIEKCLKDPRCQMCKGDMCNDTDKLFFNECYTSKNGSVEYCDYIESMCYAYKEGNVERYGCVKEDMPGIYHANVLMCSNQMMKRQRCAPNALIETYLGCYECSHTKCDDVLVSLGYTAKTICPKGTTQCYSARRYDGVTLRGCFTGLSEGVKVCKDTKGMCVLCKGNYCNHNKLVHQITGQCYKSNWMRPDRHETSLRLADCQGTVFYEGQKNDPCYVAKSTRLFMRMGCLSELVSGIDDSYTVVKGKAIIFSLDGNSCFKCESNTEGYCFDVKYLKEQQCMGLNRFPVRGCYTLIDHRRSRIERGCITELSEYMMRLCNMPIFYEKCTICQDNGCNNKIFPGFDGIDGVGIGD